MYLTLTLGMFMFEALKKYAVFDGRATRKEYWLFVLLYIILIIVFSVLDVLLSSSIFVVLVPLALLIPQLAVIVRRLHDINCSGWWILLALVPLLGSIILFVMMLIDGTKGKNRFGDDPKGRKPLAS